MINRTVKINKPEGIWASMFTGMTGTIECKCSLYKGAFVVRFDNEYASFFKREFEVIKETE